MIPTSPPTAPPGWFPDPWGSGALRWWDGFTWTAHLRPAGPYPLAPQSDPPGWFPRLAPLDIRAAWLAIAMVALTTIGGLVAIAIEHSRALAALLSLVVLGISVAGFPLSAWIASRTWGTGHPVHDLGLRIRWIDVPLGAAGAVAMTVVLIVLGLLLRLVGIPQGSNLSGVEDTGRNLAVFAFLGLFAGIVAPFTEELLFRGQLMHSLGSRLGRPAATVVQATIFGAAHITPSAGWGNVSLLLLLAVVGGVLGLIVQATGRLGTSMIAHGLFNIGQLTLLWVTLGAK